MNELISVVTPLYNAVRYLEETHASLTAQSHQNWEWLLIDDHSSDGSFELAKSWSSDDDRIKTLQTPTNSGAAVARNLGLEHMRGRYVAFLDADDLWVQSKLAEQLDFMTTSGAYFGYTGFHYVDQGGVPSGAVARPPRTMEYQQALKNTTILTSTVMIDSHRVPHGAIAFPDVRRGQDTALWWRLLRVNGAAHGLVQPLTLYRQNAGSLSSNRVAALRRTWRLYRDQEHIPHHRAAWYFGHYVVNALVRRRGQGSHGA